MNKKTLQPKKIIGMILCFFVIADIFLAVINLIPSIIAILILLAIRFLVLFM